MSVFVFVVVFVFAIVLALVLAVERKARSVQPLREPFSSVGLTWGSGSWTMPRKQQQQQQRLQPHLVWVLPPALSLPELLLLLYLPVLLLSLSVPPHHCQPMLPRRTSYAIEKAPLPPGCLEGWQSWRLGPL